MDNDGFRFRGGRLCLDFAATLGGRYREPVERLGEPADLERWFREAIPITVDHGYFVTPGTLGQAVTLREAIYRLVHPASRNNPDIADVTLVNEWAAEPSFVPTLRPDARGVSRLAAHPARAGLAEVARDTVDLLSGPWVERISECARPDCSLLFVDVSRPGKRRWCDMQACGNRAKADRYRSAHLRVTPLNGYMDGMLRVAVVGATGAVGTELLGLLAASDLPISYVLPAASPRSAGRFLPGPLVKNPVVALDTLDFTSIDVAFLTAGAPVSRKIAEEATAAGCLVIDNSSAFRGREDVPLPVPQVNPDVLARVPSSGIVANPNCSTIQLVRALAPLHARATLRQVVVSTYQAASGGGLRGLAELAGDSAAVLSERDAALAAGRFGLPLAFDLVPQIGDLDPDGASHEERKLRHETRRILSVPGLPVAATAVRAAVFHCHSEAVYARFDGPLDPREAEDALESAPGLRLYRDPSFPTPRGVEASGADRQDVHVGRVRADPDDPRGLWLWVVADNLWVGAALNAVQVLELAVANGWWD